jgi:hypothetical protein
MYEKYLTEIVTQILWDNRIKGHTDVIGGRSLQSKLSLILKTIIQNSLSN